MDLWILITRDFISENIQLFYFKSYHDLKNFAMNCEPRYEVIRFERLQFSLDYVIKEN